MKWTIGKSLAVYLAVFALFFLAIIPSAIYSKEAFVLTAFFMLGWLALGVALGFALMCWELWTNDD